MGKHRPYNNEDKFFATTVDQEQEFISNLATNFKLYQASATAVGVHASAGTGQVTIGLGGPWRYRTTDFSLTISGAKGTKILWAVGVTANDFEGAGKDPDETEYNFELRATTGAEPSGVAYARIVGSVDWDGSKITALRQTLNGTSGAMIEPGALQNTSNLEWVQEAGGGWVPNFKNASVTSQQLKPTVGILYGTGSNIVLSSSYSDVPGTELKITPVVPSKLKVWCLWSMVANGQGGVGANVTGTLSVDGADALVGSVFGEGGSTEVWVNIVLAQNYVIPLTAAEHKLKLRARTNGGGGTVGEAYPPSCSLMYELVAS